MATYDPVTKKVSTGNKWIDTLWNTPGSPVSRMLDPTGAAISQAQQQMDFQEKMSSTAYQRAMKDMEAAGLNPILAYAQGGASSPSGAMASIEDVVTPRVSTALQARRLGQEMKNLKAQNQLTWHQANLTYEQELETQARAERTRTENQMLQYGLPAARNQAAIDSGRMGQSAAWLERLLGRGPLSPLLRR